MPALSYRAALVVGINDYPKVPLRGCVNDANAMTSVLETHGNGEPNFSVRLMTSPTEAVTRPTLRAAIRQLFAADCDVCLFYFSGHGLVTATGLYIVTTDAQQYDEGISMDEIVTLANQSQAKDKVILLDCCHSGASGNPAIIGSKVALLSEGLAVLTASRSSESALEISGQGVFTSLIVGALQSGAADLRGHITSASIYAYAEQALGPWDQRPMFKANVARFTSLRSVAPPIPFETLRKIADYFPKPNQEYGLDPTYEFTETQLANPGHVATMKDLQKFASVGLVVPVGEEYMYFAAMNSKSCRLTALGQQYWRLVKEKRI